MLAVEGVSNGARNCSFSGGKSIGTGSILEEIKVGLVVTVVVVVVVVVAGGNGRSEGEEGQEEGTPV